MTSPTDRTVRFSLRLAPDEMAVCEDVQDRRGGESAVSLNTVIADLLVEGYYYRVVAAGFECLPLDSASWAYVREAADEMGISTAQALQLLIRRGIPHQPQSGCRTYVSKLVPPQDRLAPAPAPPAPPAPEPPRYASPKPAAYPPVPPVTGQVPYDVDQEGAPT